MASKHKKRRLVIYAAPVSDASPPAAPVKPAAAAKTAEGVVDFVIKLAAAERLDRERDRPAAFPASAGAAVPYEAGRTADRGIDPERG
jgi:hypothetical protein